MAQSDFAKGVVFIGGGYIKYLESFEIAGDAQNQRIDVLNDGLAGFTSGSGSVTINLSFPVPIGGFEVDYWGMFVRREYVDFQVWIGPKKYAGQGKIETCNVGQSVNEATKGSLTWVGEFKDFES